MLAAAVLNTAVPIINDQRMHRPAEVRAVSAAEQRCEPQIVVSGSQASARWNRRQGGDHAQRPQCEREPPWWSAIRPPRCPTGVMPNRRSLRPTRTTRW